MDLHLQDVARSFGKTSVLREITLAVRSGEFLTLVGPSGCGKSTLLRIIAGLEAPSAGRVLLGGHDMTQVPPARRNMAMVFQSYALYPHLSVADNLMTPLLLRDLGFMQRLPLVGPLLSAAPRRDMRARVLAVAESLRIEELLDRKPGQLSGGQRQRVALGRAIVRDPVAFLMDEPLSNLDASLRTHMRAELVELHRRLERTFVYVTHDQAEAMTMSSRIAVMGDGRILQVGRPDEVYGDPASLAVATFIGSPKINVLPVRLNGAGRAALGGIAVEIEDAPLAARWAAFRAEHLRLAPEGPSPAWPGRVALVENFGPEVHVHLALDPGGHRIVLRQPAAAAGGLGAGAPVRVVPDMARALLFDGDGQRIAAGQPLRAARVA